MTLDYKASPALVKDSPSRDELCKDVSAFANSAGGQIIYGIEEQNRRPTRIDQGSQIAREWIEQVIDSRVQPRIEGLLITPIPVVGGQHAYVLTIPQALARAPQQAPDHKYYKRQNFQSVPMEDYEIRDALRRGTTPELYVELAFAMGSVAPIEFAYQSEISHPIAIFGDRQKSVCATGLPCIAPGRSRHGVTIADAERFLPNGDNRGRTTAILARPQV